MEAQLILFDQSSDQDQTRIKTSSAKDNLHVDYIPIN